MEKTQFRLECLKLTYNHAHGPAEAVAKAKALEAYIFEEKAEIVAEPDSPPAPKEPEVKTGSRRKPVDNPGIFD